MGRFNTVKRVISNPVLILVHLCQKPPFRLVSDRFFLKLFYYAYQGRKANLDFPVSYNEKLQWMKLHKINEQYTNLTDKVLVKDFVAKAIGSEFVLPTLGVWDRAEEIDFDSLPDRFVLKCNHDSGSVVICRDKHSFDRSGAIAKLSKALHEDYYWKDREPNYRGIERKVFAEEYVEDIGSNELVDYKFFCFDGDIKFIQVDQGRFTNHIRNFYTSDWEFIDVEYGCPHDRSAILEKPLGFDEMKRLATRLAEGILHVRVDFYNTGNQIWFGEMTFHHGGGAMKIEPFDYDIAWGNYLRLPASDD